jgi:uncharacterized protein (DUF433 family)
MTDDELLARIVIDPAIMVGQPCIQGSRLPARLIVNMLAHGASHDELMAEYPRLTVEDISACLLYAARALEREFTASQAATG